MADPQVNCLYEGKKDENICGSTVLMVFPSFILSQTATPKTTAIEKAEVIQRGVVVEEVTKTSAAEKAGLQEGDVLLNWKRGDATGNVESPFDVSTSSVGGSSTASFRGFQGCHQDSHPDRKGGKRVFQPGGESFRIFMTWRG